MPLPTPTDSQIESGVDNILLKGSVLPRDVPLDGGRLGYKTQAARQGIAKDLNDYFRNEQARGFKSMPRLVRASATGQSKVVRDIINLVRNAYGLAPLL